MTVSLIELNALVLSKHGVYQAPDQAQEFAYSDGEQTELNLHRILTNAVDLSSDSAELEASIVDWPTEYHLSATRANLLKPLKLEGKLRILELGCGCGSISRYLGEQAGVIVDSVEGSPSRAALAALRCRDLDNVTIATANFNDLEFPENYYDLVLFVGVTEYAGRFSERDTDQQALQDLLALGQHTAKPDGAVLVAIENRLGLKYLQGACEDHYAVPHIGLDNYPNSTGVRTYSKAEWQLQIDAAGYNSSVFMYPFPDYKVPTLVIGESAFREAPKESIIALSKIKSRDYIRTDFDLGDQETRLWHGLLEADTLTQHANSFLILLSNEPNTLTELAQVSIAEFEAPTLDYLQPSPPLKELSQNDSRNSELQGLQRELADLQQTIEIMAGSQGWRWLNRLRSLLGRKSIK